MKLFKENISKSLISLTLIATLIIGCSEEFLETKPGASLTSKDIYTQVETAEAVLTGIYRRWRTSGSDASRTGLHSLMLCRDVMGPDVVVLGSWWASEAGYATYTQETGRVRFHWAELYWAINQVNDVLDNLETIVGTDADIDRLRGHALALRGYCYFELVNTYAPTYAIGSSMKGVPIYLEPTTAETLGNPRSTVEQVYTQILSDLTTASSLITGTRETKAYMNSNVVDGLLARVYLTMGDYSLAAQKAAAARVGYALCDAADWGGTLRDISNVEWIWVQDNNEQENGGWTSVYGWLHSSGIGEGLWETPVSLATSYSATDIRGQLCTLSPAGFYKNDKWGDYIDYTQDYPYMRSSEMYLIEAEAKAKLTDDTGAQDALYAIQFRADPNAVKSTNTGSDLIDEILLEKRKEFYGEGIVLLDMLRNSLPLVRDAGHPAGMSIPGNSWDFIFQIPESEFLINKSMEISTDQNPATGIISK
ncbi:MAG TPA: RagB/SusD family nutrient uptake outer membrane protein [Bacteroidales bacterium]|nr:RagB/SusD family nutrient uptake outer membrane protein [Bacteroidales bacterium]